MTNIMVTKHMNKNFLIIKGHSGYGISGTDIVCAAVSILTYTLINELEILSERGEVYEMSYEESDGEMVISFYGRPDGKNEKLFTAYETILGGFMAVEQKYPGYVKVTRGENIF